MRKLITLRSIFFTIIATAILVDISSDFLALQQTYVSDQTEAAVLKSYQSIGYLNDFSVALRDNLEARYTKNLKQESDTTTELAANFKAFLKNASASDKAQFEKYNYIADVQTDPTARRKLAKDFPEISKLILVIRQTQQASLKDLIAVDDAANAKSRTEIVASSIVDLFLMLFAILLWIAFDRQSRKNEIVLESTISASEKANSELQQLLLRRSKMLRTTVHDLKNPLGSIRGYSDLIEEDKNDPNSVAEMSHAVQRLSDHTLLLVNSMLELENEAIENEKSTVNVKEVLDEVCQLLKPQVLSKRQQLTCNTAAADIEIKGSRKNIFDVFTNLVGNAVKFTPLGGYISVTASKNWSKITIEIEDSGQGFSKEDKEKAFKGPGSLSAKPTGGEVSTGLGLNIAREYLLKLGGQIVLADAKNHNGARVIIELPAPVTSNLKAESSLI